MQRSVLESELNLPESPISLSCLDPGREGFENAHVIFAGLAVMFNQGSLTIDTDTRRLRLGGTPGPVVCEDEVWGPADMFI